MQRQAALDLDRRHVLASRDDQVVDAAGDEEVAVPVEVPGVAREIPAVAQRLGVGVGPAPIALERFVSGNQRDDLAFLAGAGEVAGINYQLTDGISSGFGYTGIVVATLGALTMPGVVLAALFLGDLVVGADAAGFELGVPSQLADIVKGALLLVVIALLLLRRNRIAVRRRAA
jgi:simple sugar transport system permease protein